MEDVLDAVGRAGVADIAEVALGIHRQDAVLADRLEAAGGNAGLAARALNRDDGRRGRGDAVGAVRAAGRASA